MLISLMNEHFTLNHLDERRNIKRCNNFKEKRNFKQKINRYAFYQMVNAY